MKRKKTTTLSSDIVQLALNFGEQPDNVTSDRLKVYVPVETTFDVSQGLREAITFWYTHKSPMDVVFDCRHLELAEAYVSGNREAFEPEEIYLVGKGGLINTSVFINLLRCGQSLTTWSKGIKQNTGSTPIQCINFIPPSSSTKVGKLWKKLRMFSPFDMATPPKVGQFQSRYITPILWVDKTNEADVLRKFTGWILDISDRLGDKVQMDLIMTAGEVLTNLVKHGFAHGFYGVSIWPSGQIEIVWSNSIEHLKDWPPDDTVGGLINGLKSGNRGGAGMSYIYNQLLPQYNGILAVNCKGNDLIFHASGKYSLFSQCSKERNMFLPTSILFTLHLFCPETRDKS